VSETQETECKQGRAERSRNRVAGDKADEQDEQFSEVER
jgi:hypothetical protein